MATPETVRPSALAITTVGEAMRPGVVTSAPDTRLPALAATMAAHGFHAVVVPAPDGRALAVTDLELIRAALRGGLDQTAGDIAREPMATVAPSAPLSEAVAVMAMQEVSHLLVADREAEWPAGVVSSFDVASVLAGRNPAIARMIRPEPARPLVSATDLSGTTVGAVMHPGVIARTPDTPLRELAGTMADLRVHCIAVAGVGRRSDGDEHLVWGLVSDMDVVHVAHRGMHDMPAGELAATTPIALGEDASLERAASLMADHDVAHVVAVGRSGLPSGVVSSLDVARILAAG